MQTKPINASLSRVEDAAIVALNAACNECRNANLNPEPHHELLTDFLAEEVRTAVVEISMDKRSADPRFALCLMSAKLQDIYFADAGRRAAHSLLSHLEVPHALPTTRRGFAPQIAHIKPAAAVFASLHRITLSKRKSGAQERPSKIT